MKILRTVILALFFGVAGSLAIPGIEAATTDSTAATAPVAAPAEDGKFKSFYSDGWFGTYALREFDKVAPAPGVNWYVEDAQDWLARAQREGWIVKKVPSEAVNGSIIIGYSEGLVWVGVAREVTDKGLIFETVMGGDGKPARYWMKFSDILNSIHFQGCILPQRSPGAAITSPMFDYKGVSGSSGAAWALREFDRVAVKPGYNWSGSEKNWPDEADRKGWAVEKKPAGAKPGSLMLFYNAAVNQTKVAFVREVVAGIVIFEFVDTAFGRVITHRLKIEQLADRDSFGGYVLQAYILPEKKRK